MNKMQYFESNPKPHFFQGKMRFRKNFFMENEPNSNTCLTFITPRSIMTYNAFFQKNQKRNEAKRTQSKPILARNFFRESLGLQKNLFMQSKANFKNRENTASTCKRKTYPNSQPQTHKKSKPNPNPKQSQSPVAAKRSEDGNPIFYHPLSRFITIAITKGFVIIVKSMAIYRKKNLDLLRTKPLALIIALIMFAATANAATVTTDRTAAAQTFYTQFVNAGGPIVWFLLLPMSVITGYLVINLAITIRRKKLIPNGIISEIADTHKRLGIERLIITISDRTDLVSKAALTAITKSKNLQADPKYINSLAAESLQESTMGLFRRVEWCAIIGNVAPMIGLFGTVFGMIRAFNILGVAGSQPPADQLAAAISIALVTTFWGLLVAIPALAMHGIFRSRIETIVSEAALEIEILLQRITTQPITKVPAPQITTQQATLATTPTVTTPTLVSKQPLPNKPIVKTPALPKITQKAATAPPPAVTGPILPPKQPVINKPITKTPVPQKTTQQAATAPSPTVTTPLPSKQALPNKPIAKKSTPQKTTQQATLAITPTVTGPTPVKQPVPNKPIMKKPAPQKNNQKAAPPVRPAITATTKQALPNKPKSKKTLQTQAAKK